MTGTDARSGHPDQGVRTGHPDQGVQGEGPQGAWQDMDTGHVLWGGCGLLDTP